MILGLLSMLAANAGVTLAAAALARRLEGLAPETRFLAFVLLRVAAVMAGVLLFGLAGLLRPLPLGLAGAALLGLLLLGGAHRGLPWPPRRPGGVTFALLLIAGAFLVRGLLQVWYVAPYHGDVLSYHLPLMAEWMQSGRIPGEVGNDPRSWFPAGYQLLEAWWVVFLRHDVLIEMAGIESLVLLFAAILSLARGLGLEAKEAWVSALLGAATPAAVMQSFSCFNDLPAAALVTAAAALVAARAPAALLILVGGMAAGLKPTALYAAPGLALLAWFQRSRPRLPAPSRAFQAGCAAAALLLGGIWYGRNLAVHGNPLYPMGSDAFQRVWDQEAQQLGFRAASLWTNLRDLANERLSDFRRPYHPTLQFVAGWGLGLVAIGLPGLVYAALAHAALRRLAAAFGLSLASVLLLVIPDSYNMRFVLFFAALPALAAGALLARLPKLFYPALASLALTWVTTMFSSSPDLVEFAGDNFSRGWRDRWAGHGLGEHAPKPPRVATFGGGSTFAYMLYRPDYSVQVVHLKSTTAAALKEELGRSGFQRFHAGSIHNSPREKAVIEEGVREGWLRKISPDVYEFVPSKAAP